MTIAAAKSGITPAQRSVFDWLALPGIRVTLFAGVTRDSGTVPPTHAGIRIQRFAGWASDRRTFALAGGDVERSSAGADLAHALPAAAEEIAAARCPVFRRHALSAGGIALLAGIAFERLAGMDAVVRIVRFARRAARHTLDSAEGATLAVLIRCAARLIERAFTNRIARGALTGSVDTWQPVTLVPAGAAVIRVCLEIGADLGRGRVDECQRVVETTGLLRRATATLTTGAPGRATGAARSADAWSGAVDLVRLAAVLALAAMIIDARHPWRALSALALVDGAGVPERRQHGAGAATPDGAVGRAAIGGQTVVLQLAVRHALRIGLARARATGGAGRLRSARLPHDGGHHPREQPAEHLPARSRPTEHTRQVVEASFFHPALIPVDTNDCTRLIRAAGQDGPGTAQRQIEPYSVRA